MTKPALGGGRPMGRLRNRGAIGADSTTVKHQFYSLSWNTSGSGDEMTYSQLNPGVTDEMLDSNAAGLAQFYQEYKIVSGAIRWVPAVGATTGGTVHVAFFDNPKQYAALAAMTTPTDRLGLMMGMSTYKSHPIWQEATYNVPTRLRRKWFDVDSQDAMNVDKLDRTMQVGFAMVIIGPVSTHIGRFFTSLTVQYYGLVPPGYSPDAVRLSRRRAELSEPETVEPDGGHLTRQDAPATVVGRPHS